jgi:methionine-gamma-lyase
VSPIRLLQVSNIPELAKIAHDAGAKLMVDNTFTPMIFTPAMLGADLVVYSMTKFINGKNDCVAGAICGSAEFVSINFRMLTTELSMLLGTGARPAPLLFYSEKPEYIAYQDETAQQKRTIPCRKLIKTGLKTRLSGLAKHPQYELHKTMMNEEYGFGGMMAIDFGTMGNAYAVMQRMQEADVGYLAVSLGLF